MLPSASIKMSVSKLGFMCGGKRTKTDPVIMKLRIRRQSTTRTKERQNEYEKHRIPSFQQPWGNEFQWARHTVMTDTNGADKK